MAKPRRRRRPSAVPCAAPPISAGVPERFINRELSWLQFNRRVLEEAEQRQPSAARAAALPVDLGQQSRRVLHGPRRRPQGPGARGIADQSAGRPDARASSSRRSARRSSALASDQQARWRELRDELLAPEGIVLVDADEPDQGRPQLARRLFPANIFPVLTPLAIDPAHPFPFIPNLGFTIALQLARSRATARR